MRRRRRRDQQVGVVYSLTCRKICLLHSHLEEEEEEGEGGSTLPVVENTVDHHPLHLDAVTVVFLLHLSIDGVFDLTFVALLLFTLDTKVNGRGLVHVVLALVVAEHHLTVQLQLDGGGRRE